MAVHYCPDSLGATCLQGNKKVEVKKKKREREKHKPIKLYRNYLPENVPENTPGAWLTKLSIIAPGLRERDCVLQLPIAFVVQFA